MGKLEYQKVKTSTLISVIVHGANDFGLQLAKTLSEQGSRVIVIDQFNRESKGYVTRLKKYSNVDFIAFEGINDLFSNLNRFDYLFYLQNNLLLQERDFGSKGFLEESANLENCLKGAVKFGAKMALVTTIKFHKQLVEGNATSNKKISAYSAAEIQKYSETLLAEYYDRSKLNGRILRIGTLLGAKYNCIGESELATIFKDSATRTQIVIKGEGLTNHYLINAKDALYGMLKLTFTANTAGEVISLANKKPLTTLSIAYKLLELNTEASNIRFEESHESEHLLHSQYSAAKSAEDYGWTPDYSVEDTFIETLSGIYEENKKHWELKPSQESLNQIVQEKKSEEDVNKVAHVSKTPLGVIVSKLAAPFITLKSLLFSPKDSLSASLNYKNIAIFSFLIVLFSVLSYFLFTPLLSITINGALIYGQKDDIKRSLDQRELDKTVKELDTLSNRVKKVEVGFTRLNYLFKVTGQDELYQNIEQLMFASQYGISGAKRLSTSLQPLADYANVFEPAISFGSNEPKTTREYGDYLKALKDNGSEIEKAGNELLIASKLLESVELTAFPSVTQKYVQELLEINEANKDFIVPFKNSMLFLPELLGLEERQRYLLLLQNPSELRSSGGWLSSYGLIGIENGQIRQLDVDDIYNADGQLITANKVFDPPKSMEDALDINTWSFSLSNWSADFTQAANDAQFFIKESGKVASVDGVIAIDVTLIQRLLDKWGGLTVPGESEVVTSENLYSKIFALHTEFTPGSRQKATFIANLANSTLQKLFSSDADGYKDLADVLLDGLNEKHILVSLKNSDANSYFDTEGWSGRLKQEYNATPIPVEWNWGANKANLFLTRNTTVDLNIISEDEIQYTYNLALQNSSLTEVYPEGEYVNWMRLYLPENALITSSNGFEDNKNQLVFEDGYKVLGGWFNVKPGETSYLKITYTLTREAGSYFPIDVERNRIELDLNVYKQPGTDKDKYALNITYPTTWAIIESGDLNRSASQLKTQYENSEEKEFEIEWEFK